MVNLLDVSSPSVAKYSGVSYIITNFATWVYHVFRNLLFFVIYIT